MLSTMIMNAGGSSSRCALMSTSSAVRCGANPARATTHSKTRRETASSSTRTCANVVASGATCAMATGNASSLLTSQASRSRIVTGSVAQLASRANCRMSGLHHVCHSFSAPASSTTASLQSANSQVKTLSSSLPSSSPFCVPVWDSMGDSAAASSGTSSGSNGSSNNSDFVWSCKEKIMATLLAVAATGTFIAGGEAKPSKTIASPLSGIGGGGVSPSNLDSSLAFASSKLNLCDLMDSSTTYKIQMRRAASTPVVNQVDESVEAPLDGALKYSLEGGMINLSEGPDAAASAWKTRTMENPAVLKASMPRAYDVSVRALKGSRLYMEDEYFIGNGGRFAAVFDGHGGGGVSSYLRDRLYTEVGKHLVADAANFDCREMESDTTALDNSTTITPPKFPTITARVAAIRAAFDKIDNDILKNDDLQYQGSTAVAVVLHEEMSGQRTLLSANVGDSRAILSRKGKAVNLTRDHKPNDEREMARIVSMGETIEWDNYCKVHRVKNLSLSRAMGDRFAKPAVSGEVEIKRYPVCEDDDEFFLIASDGLWDVMTSQDAVSYVHKRLNAPLKDSGSETDVETTKYARRKNMSRYVANEALRKGSGDNVCVVIVWLKDLDKMFSFH